MCSSSGRTMDHHYEDIVCVARVQDHLRGGGHSFSSDRRYADADPEVAQVMRRVLRREREFLTRAVLFMLDRGIRQFLDLGSGLPSEGGVHDITEYLDVNARVIHVDTDPAVIEHGRIIVGDADKRTHFLCGDATRPGRVLTDCVMSGILDLHEPVGVLAVGLPHLVPSLRRPRSFLPEYGAALVGGSAMALTHLTPWFAGRLSVGAARLVAGPGRSIYPRRRRQIVPMFDGFDLVQPGIVSLSRQWSWGLSASEPGTDDEGTTLAGLGVKP